MTVRGRSATLRSNWTLKFAATIAIAVAVFATLLGQETPAATSNVKVSDQVLNATAGGQEASFVVYLDEQADLSAAQRRSQDEDARGRYVYKHASKLHAAHNAGAPFSAQARRRGGLVQVLLGRQHDRRRRRSSRRPGPCRAQRRRRRSSRTPASDGLRGSPRTTPPRRPTKGTRSRPSRSASPTFRARASVDARLHAAKASSWRTRTPACAGPTLRSGCTTAAGAARIAGFRPQLQLARLDPRADHQRGRWVRRRPPTNPCGFNAHGSVRRPRATEPTRRARPSATTPGPASGSGTNQIGVAPGSEVDRLPQHGRGQRPGLHLHRVLPVLPRADEPRQCQNADPTKRPARDEQQLGLPACRASSARGT